MSRLTKDNFKTERAMEGFNKLVPQLQELCDSYQFTLRGKIRKINRDQKTISHFMKKVSIAEGGCWEWNGYIAPNGYGVFNYLRSFQAHRAALFLFKGIKPIKTSLVADHLCRNRRCVNPEHLEMVTSAVNALRGSGPPSKNRFKTHCPDGHPYNIKLNKDGRRVCKICLRRNTRFYRIRKEISMNIKEFKPEYFKTELAMMRSVFCCETIIMIMRELISFCEKEKIKVCFTETATLPYEDRKLNRKSTSHCEGRAFDFSVRELTEDQILLVTSFLNDRFSALGAISSDGNRKLVVDHDSGNGRHLHLQLHSSFAKKDIQKQIEAKC